MSKSVRYRVCITIEETTEESLNENEETADDPVSEEVSQPEPYDQSLFEEPGAISEEISTKKTRIIQSAAKNKEEIMSCLIVYTDEKDIVEAEVDNRVRFIVDISSEECVLLNLVCTDPTMTITDLANVSPEQ